VKNAVAGLAARHRTPGSRRRDSLGWRARIGFGTFFLEAGAHLITKKVGGGKPHVTLSARKSDRPGFGTVDDVKIVALPVDSMVATSL
jgi:hypothetical protein